ncbi:hypothetical protein H4V96_001914 [Janthinobacterium sp. CG_23.4]|nr:hypothetical protein [Janthinobacterium sp. CG_23.4]
MNVGKVSKVGKSGKNAQDALSCIRPTTLQGLA